jgi:hypothetical protein
MYVCEGKVSACFMDRKVFYKYFNAFLHNRQIIPYGILNCLFEENVHFHQLLMTIQ